MKTNLKTIIMSLIFILGLIASVNASNHIFTPTLPVWMQNWRLNEQVTKIDTTRVDRAWQNMNRANYYYRIDNPVLIDSTIFSYYDNIEGWIPFNIDSYGYDSTGQYLTQIVSKMDFMGEVTPITRCIFDYYGDNHLKTATMQITGLDREWFDNKRTHIIYNNNNLASIVSWQQSGIYRDDYYTKSEFIFDPQGRISIQTDYSSTDSTNWTPIYRTNYDYDSGDVTTGASLVDLISRTYPRSWFYNETMQIGKISEATGMDWMYEYWRNKIQETYTYDNTGCLSIQNRYFWTMGGYWANESMRTYCFDVNHNQCSDLIQNWNDETLVWQNYMTTENTWEQLTPVEEDIAPVQDKLALNVYPNPFKDSFSIETASKILIPVKCCLYNCKGQMLYQIMIDSNAKTTLNNNTFMNKKLGAGIYFLKATQGNQTTCKKIIKLN